MTDALDPVALLRALHDAGVRHIVVGGLAVSAHGYVRPSKDLDIVPDADRANLARLAQLLRDLGARQVGVGDLDPSEFPFDPTDPDDIAEGSNFRLHTRLGDLDVMQWLAGLEDDDAYGVLVTEAIEGELEGIPIRICGLRHLRAMKEAAGRPRDLDDLANLPEA